MKKNMSDGIYNQCKVCRKQNYNENLVKIKKFYLDNRDRKKNNFLQNRDRIKKYKLKNHDKIFARKKIYSNNRYKTDMNFCLYCGTRSRIDQILGGKRKSNSAEESLGINIDT